MRTSHALLTAVVLTAGAATAWAQGAATYDPSQLPATQGKVAQYSLTPRGDVDGLILSDGTEVHMPPHLGTSLVFAVKPGDAVTIRGLKARAAPMIQAMEISNDATHATVTDTGAGPGGRGMPPLTAQGKVKMQLHGPRGELNGVLLTDGTIIHLPPPEARRLAATLGPDASLYVSGMGYAGPLGRVIEAREIGPNAKQLTQIVAPPPPGPGPGGPGGPGRPGGPGPGPGGPGYRAGGPPPPPPGAGPAAPPPGAGLAAPPPGAGPAAPPPGADPAAPPPGVGPAAPPPGAGPAGDPAAMPPGGAPAALPATPPAANPR